MARVERILASMDRSGPLDPAEVAAIDQFHLRGREATRNLARLAEIGAGEEVLDVGGGLGGSARMLARDLGCRVTVLDLTEAYCRLGQALTRRMGQEDVVTFRHGSAVAMPFEEGRFDVTWMQHASMNIEDTPGLWREIHRVLRPGGRLALHELMLGPAGGPLHFPVPWAREPALSFVGEPAGMRRLLGEAGFEERAWIDASSATIDWMRGRPAGAPPAVARPGGLPPSASPGDGSGPRPAAGGPRLGLHLLVGADFPVMLGNLRRNLEEGRLVVIKAVFSRA